jgi:hypothetical protein
VSARTRELLKLMAATGCPIARAALRPDMGHHAERILRLHPTSHCQAARDTFATRT